MLLNFDEENGKIDGYTIVKNSDVEKYRIWQDKDYAEVKNDNSESLIAKINLNDFTDLEESLNSLVSEIVSIFAYNDEDSFLVGKILWVKNDSVELQLIDEDSNWSENVLIKLSDISYLGFETEYEREINKNVVNS
jgi:hypothetical protein